MCILSRHDGARLCPFLHFKEPRKMLCQTLFKPTTAQGRQLPSAPTHGDGKQWPPQWTGLSSSGKSQGRNPDCRSISARFAIFTGGICPAPGLNGHLCGQREKGETERRVEGDEGGAKWESWSRNSAVAEWSVWRTVRTVERVRVGLLKKAGWTAERPAIGRASLLPRSVPGAERSSPLTPSAAAQAPALLFPQQSATAAGWAPCKRSGIPPRPKHRRGVANKRPKDAL